MSTSRMPLALTETLAQRVVGGEWDDGTALPTELELAGQLGVARTSVREALSRLKAKGLLASRQKPAPGCWTAPNGTCSTRTCCAGSGPTATGGSFAHHLMQLRRVVEPAACEMAASVAPDSAIADIERAYRQMDAAGMDAVAYAVPDLMFHRAILAATGNPFLVSFGAMVEAALRMSFEISSTNPGAPRKSLPLHRKVLEQIWARDPGGARLAMEKLLGVTEHNIQRGLTQARPDTAKALHG